MIARQAIKNPIDSGNVRIVEGTVNAFGSVLVPTRPALPVEIAAVVHRRQLVWLVVEQTLAHAILPVTLRILQLAPQHTIHKLLDLLNLAVVRLTELLHQQS